MALFSKNSAVESFRDECSTTASSNEGESPRSCEEDHSAHSPVVKIAATSACKATTAWCRFLGCLDHTVLSFGAIFFCCIAFATYFISSDIWFECFCSASIGLVIVVQIFHGTHGRKAKQVPQKTCQAPSAKPSRCSQAEVQPRCKTADPQVMPRPRPAKPQLDSSKDLPAIAHGPQQGRQISVKSAQRSPVPLSTEILAPPGLVMPTEQECLMAALNRAIQNTVVPPTMDSIAPRAKDERTAHAVNAGVVSLPPGLELPLKQKRTIASAKSEVHHLPAPSPVSAKSDVHHKPAPPPGLETAVGLPMPSRGQVVIAKKVGPVPHPPGLARPSAQEFSAASFNRELVAILRDLAANSNVGAAVLRTRMQNVPMKRQANVFVDILTRACEETRGPYRRSFLAFAAGLAAADESAFDKMECLVGVQLFFAEVYDSLCYEVTGLQRVIQAEVLPTLLAVYSQEKLDAFVPKSLRP